MKKKYNSMKCFNCFNHSLKYMLYIHLVGYSMMDVKHLMVEAKIIFKSNST